MIFIFIQVNNSNVSFFAVFQSGIYPDEGKNLCSMTCEEELNDMQDVFMLC